MTTIEGSIDNAWKRGKTTNIHHLIFLPDSLLIFDVLNKREIRKDVIQYLRSDPLTLAPISAVQDVAFYRDSKQIHEQIINMAIEAGNQIEKNIDAEIAKVPPEFQRIDYAEIRYISLKQGKLMGLPLLEISASQGDTEYKLMHNNYEKMARLDDETFQRYSDLLTKTLGARAKVEE
ncbi:MAG: hypothetical protein AMDU1_APLC00003G0003 [Thermoplasmatales archaeon A-plasma]|jgi:predicted nucleic acid-binding protein|nr:MAG: hypothetical protein AMDU1_APLC00003G0003 [Thermoplasmatales archaeon A-plasma]WMT44398.1 MAG: hypothetical protein RE469_09355 [Cuniculiplasma divulgatum]